MIVAIKCIGVVTLYRAFTDVVALLYGVGGSAGT